MAYQDLIDKINAATPVVAEPATPVTPEQPAVSEREQYIIDMVGADRYNQYKNPDPNVPIYSQLFRENIKEPAKINEKAMRAGRIASSLGDTLGTLAETFAASRGAHIKPRDFNESATAKQARNEKEVRNLYEQRLAVYNQGVYGAAAADAQIGEANKRANANMVVAAMKDYDKKKAEQAERERLQKKYEEEQSYKDKTYEETVRRNKASEATARFSAETGRMNAERINSDRERKLDGYSWGYGKDKSGNEIRTIQVPAKAGEENVVTTSTGERVYQIQVKPQDISYYANQGKIALKNNDLFIAKYGDVIENSVASKQIDFLAYLSGGGTSKQKREADEVIAAIYAQYMYETGGQQSTQPQEESQFAPGGKYSVVPPTGGTVR